MVIRPAGVAEVLDTGFNLARHHYRPLVIVSAWGIVPPTILQALAAGQTAGTTFTDALSLSLLGLTSVLTIVGTILASMALTIACARIVEQSSDSVELQPSGLYAAACRRIPGSILLAIVAAVASIPLLLLLPLGAYVYGRWLVSWVALLVEGTGPVASLGRSWDLTRRSWWHTIAIGFAATLIIGVLSGLISSIFQGIGAILSSVAGAPVIGAILTSLGGAISGPLMEPFSAALLVVLYYELRARREGFDLEQRARQMTSPA